MAKREAERTVQQSLLDRLIDTDPRTTVEAPATWSQSVRDLKEAVRRDVEWLLNTRRIAEPAPEAFEEVRGSLYHYGLPDISSLSADAPETRGRLIRQVEEALGIFEPRLSGVHVSLSLVESDDEDVRELRFLIEGLLLMEPSPEQVAFDTVFEISSGKFHVK